MKQIFIRYFLILFALGASFLVRAQNDATFQETTKSYRTYPFSNPDPIPSTKIYPYFRFDGFTDKAIEQDWKVVILENDYISVQIMPEIGGKVWTAIDKKTGKPFLYDNGVVKFRDIAMRGPWISGGIEANYGIIGHTPNSSTPVDYIVRSNQDGSVSCFTSALDLLTRTRWVLEIKVEKDKAYFTTRSFWFNGTGVEQPYYTWMNAGIPEGEGLKFLYPGNHSIGHDGGSDPWSVDEKGRDLAYHAQNNFGDSKSYHIMGAHSNYFGALWEKENFGMIHYANREEKLGKKIFMWALSDQGGIWEDLLTDDSGQYVEIQSGRLFNQNVFSSSLTPFKQIGFSPYASDNWTEYWYPFSGIGGFSTANLIGAFALEYDGNNNLTIRLSPVQILQDSLFVYNEAGDKIASSWITAKPMDPVATTLKLPTNQQAAELRIKGHVLDLRAEQEEQKLSRPTEIAAGFDAESSYGLYLQGRDLARFRDYARAEPKIRASLEKDPLYLPSLVEYAKLKYHSMDYDSAFHYLKKALSIDTYDGQANYYYGLVASKLKRPYDALDGFELASLTTDYRNAAYTALAHHYFQAKDLRKAKEYAAQSIKQNAENIDILQIQYLIADIEQDQKALNVLTGQINLLDPINHFLRFEHFWQLPSQANQDAFSKLIRNEMPAETYLELGIWYHSLGLEKQSQQVLALAHETTEILFWLAFLHKDTDRDQSTAYLNRAHHSSPAFVFPFREESAEVLEWASTTMPQAWQADYLLALLHDFRGNHTTALDRLIRVKGPTNFAPFHILKARLLDPKESQQRLVEVDQALKLNPSESRYLMIKASLLQQQGDWNASIDLMDNYYQKNKEDYVLGLRLVNSLIREQRYTHADKILTTLHVLPFEGATDARRYYRETKLMLAATALKDGRYKQALAFVEQASLWPSRLGVGEPYPALIDASLENLLKGMIYEKIGQHAQAQRHYELVKNKEINASNYIERIQSITTKKDQRMF